MKIILIVGVIILAAGAIVLAGARRELRPSGAAVAEIPESPRPGAPLSSDALAQIIAQKDPRTFLVDVRTAEEFRAGAIPSAINVPYDVIQDNLPTTERSARIIVYCRSGNRSGVAARTLASLGFTNVLDFGGIGRWTGELVRP
jgi:rhodanese-related sulfurtransferase